MSISALRQSSISKHREAESAWRIIAQHRRPVRDHAHRIPPDCQRVRLLDVFRDRHADPSNARSVRHREVTAGLDRDLVADLDLPTQVLQERHVRYVDDLYAPNLPDGDYGLLGMIDAAGCHGDVPGHGPRAMAA